MSQPYKVCPQCQQPAALTDPACARCGRQYRTQFAPPINQTQMVQPARIMGTHSVFTAVLFSLIFPGGGQYYNGQFAKSWVLFLSTPILLAVGILGIFTAGRIGFGELQVLAAALAPICWILIPIVWFVQILDAAFIAGHIQHGHPVKPWDWF